MSDILKSAVAELKQEFNQTPAARLKQRMKQITKESKERKGYVIVVDPVTLEPIKAPQSKESQGFYKKFNKKSFSIPDTLFLKTEAVIDEKILNLFKEAKAKTIDKSKTCPDGQEINPKSGRCVKKKCLKTEKLDPKTKKCVPKTCPENQEINPKTGRCVKKK